MRALDSRDPAGAVPSGTVERSRACRRPPPDGAHPEHDEMPEPTHLLARLFGPGVAAAISGPGMTAPVARAVVGGFATAKGRAVDGRGRGRGAAGAAIACESRSLPSSHGLPGMPPAGRA